MKYLKDNLVGILFTLAAFAVVALSYAQMPERVPTHWNYQGVADGFMSKPWGPFFMPLMMVGLLVFFNVVRAVSPKSASIEAFGRVYSILVSALFAFFFVLTVAATLAGTGAPVNMSKVVMISVGALFVVLGNFMGKVTRNYFIGIRTPWTLEDEEVWHRTHRLGGKVFVVAGLATILVVLLDLAVLALPIVLAMAAVPVIYSYLVHRRLSRRST